MYQKGFISFLTNGQFEHKAICKVKVEFFYFLEEFCNKILIIFLTINWNGAGFSEWNSVKIRSDLKLKNTA